jgi:hypothetical protein
VRPPVGPFEELLDRMLPYLLFAERWHWPPSVVEGESLVKMRALAFMAGVVDEVRDAAQAAGQAARAQTSW